MAWVEYLKLPTEMLVSIAMAEYIVLRILRPKAVNISETTSSVAIALARKPLRSFVTSTFGANLIITYLFTNYVALLMPYVSMRIPRDQWWYYPVLFFSIDFLYYWEHRFKHSVRWTWASHQVHHSPEYFNLTMATRIGWGGGITVHLISILPLLFLGFHPVDIADLNWVSLTYQYIVHLEWCPKLGWFEKFMVTPSHHRVHHARNPQYINRNYGAVFIVFDKWFGTFAEEKEPCEYGITTPLKNQNPVWVLTAGWVSLFKDLWQCRSFKEVVLCIVGPPK